MSLSTPIIRELLRYAVAVRLDSDEPPHVRQVMMQRIEDFPTLLLFAPSGTRLFELPYAVRFDPPQFAGALLRAFAELPVLLQREAALEQRVLDDPRSVEANDALAAHYRRGYRFEDANAQMMRAYQLAQEQTRADCDQRLVELVASQLKLRQFGEAQLAIETFNQLYPTSPHRERVMSLTGLTRYYGEEDLDGAAKAWAEQLSEYPGGSWSEPARNMLGRSQNLMRDREKLGPAFPREWGGK